MDVSKSPVLAVAVLLLALTAGIVGVRIWAGNPAAGGPAAAPPPPFADGSERILHGADRAFERGEFRPAFDFYRGWELRQAGSAAHEANQARVLARIRVCGGKLGEPREALEKYLGHRRELQERWLALQGKPAGPEHRALRDLLPDEDGRRARLGSMIGGK
jgi:hypothetical protein